MQVLAIIAGTADIVVSILYYAIGVIYAVHKEKDEGLLNFREAILLIYAAAICLHAIISFFVARQMHCIDKVLIQLHA